MAKAKSEPKDKKAASPAVAEAEVVETKPAPEPAAGTMVHQPKVLAPAPPKPAGLNFTAEQIALVKNTVGVGLTDMEFEWGMYVAKHTNLDPLRKQVYFIKRRRKKKGEDGWEEYLTIQTSIEGARAVADRSRCYAPSERQPSFIYRDDEKTHKPVLFSATVWVKKFTPIDGSWHEYGATCVFDEFVPLEKDGPSEWKIGAMWARAPHNQLEKCAEFKALKRGFPEELSDLTIAEEQARVDAEMEKEASAEKEASGEIPASQARKRRERGTLKESKEPNRGHDKEGYVEHGGGPNPEAVKAATVKKEEKPLEQIAVEVIEIKPLLKKLTTAQIEENKNLQKEKKAVKYEPQPYYVLKCKGDIDISAWDKHLFRAAIFSKGKKCTFGITRKGSYINLAGVTEIAGQPFVIDPDTKDWIPKRVLDDTKLPEKPAAASAQSLPENGPFFTLEGDVIGFQDTDKGGRKLETRTHEPMVAITILDLPEDRKHDPHAVFVCLVPSLFPLLKLAEGERGSFTYIKHVEPNGTLWQIIKDVHQIGDRQCKDGKIEEPKQPAPSASAETFSGNLWRE